MNLHSIRETARHVAEHEDYEHLLLYAHGGLNSIADSARRTAAMKEVFKTNGIYPFHFMYDTGLLEEIKDLVIGKEDRAEERAAGFTDFTDTIIENATRHAGRAIWREMKRGAQRPFDAGAYRKSLLYLVSNAFEEARGERILGMQVFRRFLGQLPGPQIFKFELSNGSTTGGRRTASTTHGGFDNDPATINDVLRSVLRSAPARPFTSADLDY